MPTRLIKESCRTSKNLMQVSDFAERLFWRLLTTADDFGRCYGDPTIVRANCFTLSTTLTMKRITDALHDLQRHHLITCYTVGDREYVQFCTFEKHQGKPRAKYSKYPSLTSLSASRCPQMPADARRCLQVCAAPDTDTDTSPVLKSLNPLRPDPDLKSKNLANKNASLHEFEQFWQQYPRKIGKKAALAAWMKAQDKPALPDVLLAIDRAKRSEQWQKDGGQFIPHPATWLNQGRWADTHEARPLSVMEKFLARHQEEL